MTRLFIVALRQLLVDMRQRSGFLSGAYQAAFQWREHATQLAGTRQVASAADHLPQALHGGFVARTEIQTGQRPINGHTGLFHRTKVSEQAGATAQIESEMTTRHDRARWISALRLTSRHARRYGAMGGIGACGSQRPRIAARLPSSCICCKARCQRTTRTTEVCGEKAM